MPTRTTRKRPPRPHPTTRQRTRHHTSDTTTTRNRHKARHKRPPTTPRETTTDQPPQERRKARQERATGTARTATHRTPWTGGGGGKKYAARNEHGCKGATPGAAQRTLAAARNGGHSILPTTTPTGETAEQGCKRNGRDADHWSAGRAELKTGMETQNLQTADAEGMDAVSVNIRDDYSAKTTQDKRLSR